MIMVLANLNFKLQKCSRSLASLTNCYRHLPNNMESQNATQMGEKTSEYKCCFGIQCLMGRYMCWNTFTHSQHPRSNDFYFYKGFSILNCAL